LIADRTSSTVRGRAIGTNDTFGGASSIALPLVGGPLAAAFGLEAVGIFAVALMVLPVLLLSRLREPSPGRYSAQPLAPEAALLVAAPGNPRPSSSRRTEGPSSSVCPSVPGLKEGLWSRLLTRHACLIWGTRGPT
jgi:hypothetical protein